MRASIASSSGAGSGATSMAASPIVFTSRTGGSATSTASAASRVAIAPRSAAGTPSPSRVKPTTSQNPTLTSCTSERRPRGQLLRVDDLLAQVLPVVEQVQDAEQLGRGGRQLAHRGREPQRVRGLRVARLRERGVGDRAGRRGGVRGRLAEHARGLDQPVERHPGLEEARERPRAEHVQLAERRDVGAAAAAARRRGAPPRAPRASTPTSAATSRAVRRPARAERPLGGQQRQPPLRDRRAQLLERDAVRVQRRRAAPRATTRAGSSRPSSRPSAAKSGGPALTRGPAPAPRPARRRRGSR